MDFLFLFLKTIIFRPYVFIFLAAFLFSAVKLLGWPRTWRFWLASWITAFACEFSSTRTGIPFGWYHYTGSTVGQELYLSNVPFMDSLSFSFLLYASYCLALLFTLPLANAADGSSSVLPALRFDRFSRTSWPVALLTVLFFAMIDMVIDPAALRGDRWFLGKIYYYPEPGVHFGVPIANYIGWAVVGTLSLLVYFPLDRRFPAAVPTHQPSTATVLLLGCGLYYGVLIFNLAVTFWIGESLQGTTGVLLYLPITVLLALRLTGRMPA
ncbi:MAG TPA: carotenoid biosynthesis protein [Nitrospiraceae bacterium]|nr:carotenoid biosynthesis protein [Nitrospiraceae bacterium]